MREIAVFEEPVKKRKVSLVLVDVNEIEIPNFQRDISPALKKRLMTAIEKLGFLVPIILVKRGEKLYVIDGQHRLEALKDIGGKEILAILVDEELYRYFLELNTEKPPNVKEKSKQAYRLYMDLLKENPEQIEEDLIDYFEKPEYITLGFAIEEVEPKFPASFYENFVSKIDRFLYTPLKSAVEERRKRAKALAELNQIVNQKYAEFGWDNALLKGEIIKEAIQKVYGARVRVISDDFYDAVEKVKRACESLTIEDFEKGADVEL
ncbi:ParB/RepB/Spo0J family partition protein [Thermocrinis jamiesonii]|uniref:ParB/RepB/Spo0J family partition protein n=1 Tax=Thermocrinis jamiesonii TaxID=1302351 RepID=UPI0004964842|nr:ParB N-terminal domain-containing protein [Thermocrinis jamiesonii]